MAPNKTHQALLNAANLTFFTLLILVDLIEISSHPSSDHTILTPASGSWEQPPPGLSHPQQQQQASNRQNGKSICPKNWTPLGQKCYKFSSGRNLNGARSRCNELSSQLVIIEDDSSHERESPDNTDSPTIQLLSYLTSEKSKHDVRFLVNISHQLERQYEEKVKEELQSGVNSREPTFSGFDSDKDSNPASEIWLPSNDPSVVNITINPQEVHESALAFALVYSRNQARWGLVQVSPTKRFSFICERPIDNSTQQSQSQAAQSNAQPTVSIATLQQTSQPKRVNDLNAQSTNSFTSQTNTEARPSASPTNADQKISRPTTPSMDSPVATVEQPSVLFREIPKNQSAVLGSTVELHCSPIENESSVSWTFDGRNLTFTGRIKLNSIGHLRIEHVRNTDDGRYTCTISSAGLTESRSARVEILERPHQPQYVTADLLDRVSTSVRVGWTPGFNGNSPILQYLVQMRTVESDIISETDLQSLMQSNQWETAKANISADHTSVIVPDLKPAKRYIFRVKAMNKIGTGDPSVPNMKPIEVPVQPPSRAPENLVGSPKSSTSIIVQWSQPPVDSHNGILKGYKIRHKLAGYASDTDWYSSDAPDVSRLSFVLDDLITWQNYEIQVAAENDKGVGPYSQSIFVRTKEGRPDKGPKYVSAEATSSTSIKVKWWPPPPQHINGVNQGYRVKIYEDAFSTQLVKEKQVAHGIISPEHSVIVDGLQPYTDYYITVNCYTNAGDGPSNEDVVIVKTKQDYPEAVPSLEFADVLDKSLRLLWQHPKRINGELDKYTLEYSESLPSNPKVTKIFPGTATEARITDLSPQTTYYFKIFPHTSVGQGPARANQTTTSVPPVLPEPPRNLQVRQVESQSVVLQFEPGFSGNAHIDRWIVEALSPSRGDIGPRWQNIYESTNHTERNSIKVRNLRPFTRYMLRLTPVNIVGPSMHPSDTTHEFLTAQAEPESAPRDFSIEDIRSNSVLARWSPLPNSMWRGNPHGYNLTWIDINNSTSMHAIINDTRADSFHVRDLEEFTDYVFKIYALNDVGLSPASESISITTIEDVPSSGPSNLTGRAVSSTTISIDWSAVPKRHRNGIIRGYKVQYQSMRPDSTLQHKVIEDNSTRHLVLHDLKPHTTYQLAVAAFTTVGDGVYGSVITITTLEDTPGPPQNFTYTSVSHTNARILWDPPEEPNGDILAYKVTYQELANNSKEVSAQDLHHNEHTFKATNLKPNSHYVFTVTARTKEGLGRPTSLYLFTSDSDLLPFYRQSWFTIFCASLSIVITIIVTALLYIQTKSYQYKQDAIKSTSQDRLGFSIDDDIVNHYNNNGFGMLSQNTANHRRSNGALSQSKANYTLPKSPPRPHPGSVVYSDEGEDDVFENVVSKPGTSYAGSSRQRNSSSDSLTEKPSEISSSTAPESESGDEEYVNMANKHFVNHYVNVNGTIRGQKSWRKNSKQLQASYRTNPKLPQRPAPMVPQVPNGTSSSDNTLPSGPVAGPSGVQRPAPNGIYAESQDNNVNNSQIMQNSQHYSMNGSNEINGQERSSHVNTQKVDDLTDSHIVNLNGGRIIVDNMAGSRAPLPGFTSFV